jgi:hypothetical protein
MTLEQYDFEIEHRKGSLHGNADALSRIHVTRHCRRVGCDHCAESGKNMTSVQVANAGQLRNVEVLETETGGNIAGVAEQKVMWVSCSPESKREQPSHSNVFADGLSQMSRRRLEASDNYAAGCPGELNLTDNLSSSIMKEVRKVDEEGECEICPNYWMSHDPIDSLKANECSVFKISLNNALPSSGLCAALTCARAPALGRM